MLDSEEIQRLLARALFVLKTGFSWSVSRHPKQLTYIYMYLLQEFIARTLHIMSVQRNTIQIPQNPTIYRSIAFP